MSHVQVLDESLVIDGLEITQPSVLAFFQGVAQDDWDATMRRAIELGAFCLERANTSADLDFVRQQMETQLVAVSGEIAKIPGKLEEELRKRMGTEDGQVLAPIKQAVASTHVLITQRLADVRRLLDEEIDPRKPETTLGRAIAAINRLLDAKYEDSVQKCVERAIDGLSKDDGALIGAVKKTLNGEIKTLREELDRLAKEVRGQQEVEAALGETTAKGRTFEDDLVANLQPWAANVGAEIDHVGPDNLPGDVLVMLSTDRLQSISARIVIEARDRGQALGRKPILEQMSRAIETRSADFGIYVSRTPDGLAQQIGDWAELQTVHGPVVACTLEHLRTALRFAMVNLQLRQSQACSQLDPEKVKQQVELIRNAMNRIRSINTKAGAIRSGADAITEEANQLKQEVHDALQNIELALLADGVAENAVAEQ